VVAIAFLLTVAGSVRAAPWTGTLQDGSVLKVDPNSHRASRYHNGGITPLWDGTHRLEDGSVVIVRDGQAVPNESMIRSWGAEPGSEPSLTERYCDQLVRKVCGFHAECAGSQPCALAHQLLNLEREQQRRAPVGAGPWPVTPSSTECQDALSNPAFPACSVSVPPVQQTPCKKLVDKVCGAGGECKSSKPCDPALQLMQMESDERLQSADPDAKTPTGAECEKAMDNAYFAPCE
jgi:hypothetical protein